MLSQRATHGLSTASVSLRDIHVRHHSRSPPSHTDSSTPTVIEAEVRYAVRHEYAETAIDVIARRCRLSFLNAQATLDALPRVVELMAEEAHWSPARAKAETAAATEFLLTMGLMPGAAPRRPVASEPKSVLESVESALGIRHARRRRAAQEMVYSRAQFDAGEVEAFKRAFDARATVQVALAQPKLETTRVYDLVKGLPGFDAVRPKDYDYVMDEVGYARSEDVDFDEFVEVSFFVHIRGLGCSRRLMARS